MFGTYGIASVVVTTSASSVVCTSVSVIIVHTLAHPVFNYTPITLALRTTVIFARLVTSIRRIRLAMLIANIIVRSSYTRPIFIPVTTDTHFLISTNIKIAMNINTIIAIINHNHQLVFFGGATIVDEGASPQA
jgi:hypothetical protein